MLRFILLGETLENKIICSTTRVPQYLVQNNIYGLLFTIHQVMLLCFCKTSLLAVRVVPYFVLNPGQPENRVNL